MVFQEGLPLPHNKSIEETMIGEVFEAKLLAIKLDPRQNFNLHINEMTKKLYRLVTNIYRIRKNLNFKRLNIFCYSIMHPKITHCASVKPVTYI